MRIFCKFEKLFSNMKISTILQSRKANLSYLFLALAAAIFSLCSCNRQEYRRSEGIVWHTTYNIVYQSSADLSDTITRAMRNVEMSLSPFQRNSLISKINSCEDDSVDNLIAAVFTESQRINVASAGAFDPTVGPLVYIWGFGNESITAEPTQQAIDSCLALVGIADCRLVGNTITKKAPNTQFNFSAITKGFGCDEVARAIERNGCNNYMVEIGGEIALKGMNPNGEKWRVMVDAPIDTAAVVHERLAIIEVTDCGIATSGNYRNYREGANGRYGHTISPTTGRPFASEILSATIIAPTAMTADALATASMAMPRDSAVSLIEAESCAALFVVAGTPWEIITTSKFPQIEY